MHLDILDYGFGLQSRLHSPFVCNGKTGFKEEPLGQHSLNQGMHQNAWYGLCGFDSISCLYNPIGKYVCQPNSHRTAISITLDVTYTTTTVRSCLLDDRWHCPPCALVGEDKRATKTHQSHRQPCMCVCYPRLDSHLKERNILPDLQTDTHVFRPRTFGQPLYPKSSSGLCSNTYFLEIIFLFLSGLSVFVYEDRWRFRNVNQCALSIKILYHNDGRVGSVRQLPISSDQTTFRT